MREPPLAGRALLWLVLPSRDRDTITGDLEEEFALVAAAASPVRASWWYLRQALKSVPHAIRMRWCRGELQPSMLAGLAVFAIPLRLVDLGWAWTLSQVPLKADTWRSDSYLWSLALFAFAAAGLAGVVSSRWTDDHAIRASALVAVWSTPLVAAFLASTPSRWPFWYAAVLFVIAPAGSLAGGAIVAAVRKENSK